MNDDNIVLGDYGTKFFECKLTVEGEETYGGSKKKTSISFEGYWPEEMYDALADSIKKVVGE